MSEETNTLQAQPLAQTQSLTQPQTQASSSLGEIANPDGHLLVLSRRQQTFVKEVVWGGLSQLETARRLAIPDSTAFRWMRLPTILGAIKAEEKVLRSSARIGNIHALQRVRDTSDNSLAVVQAVKALEQLADQEQGTAAPGQSRGYVIVITPRLQLGWLLMRMRNPLEMHG